MTTEHAMKEGETVTLNVQDHPGRGDSPTYDKSKKLMQAICKEAGFDYYGAGAPQDHHSGFLWFYKAGKWYGVQNLAGVEWSAQWCADPAKIERLRQNAEQIVTCFPETLTHMAEMGHPEQEAILKTPITDAAGVALYVDSIWNASMPLPQPVHTGTVGKGDDGRGLIAGIHHIPKPIWDQQFIKRDDFCLFVVDEEGHTAAVNPVAAPGSGDGRVQVVYAHPGSKLHADQQASHAAGQPHILEADHPLAQQAFGAQA